MTERLYKIIIPLMSILIWMGITGNVSAQKVQVEEKIDSMEIVLGDQCHLYLTVTAKEKSSLLVPDFTASHLIMPGIEVIGQAMVDSVMLDDGWLRTTYEYTITSFEPKLHYIAPLSVIVDGKKYMGKKLALKVLDVPVNTTKMDQFFPPKDVQTNPFLLDEWIPLFILYGIASLIAVLGMLAYLLKKGNRPIRISFRIIRRVPAHVKAITAIDELKQERMVSSDNQKEYYTRLTDTLRKYLEERFGFSAMEMTTSEIITRLSAEDPMKVAELRELFETADLVKFAKYSTLINEKDRNLVSAIDFINSTKTEETVTEQREETKLTDDEKRKNISLKVLKYVVYVSVVIVMVLLVYILWQVVLLIE
ncbi:MAG: BatD family protein [Bacteroidales bacterium]|nr:BatD family protein [Bacteroidales bacterium]